MAMFVSANGTETLTKLVVVMVVQGLTCQSDMVLRKLFTEWHLRMSSYSGKDNQEWFAFNTRNGLRVLCQNLIRILPYGVLAMYILGQWQAGCGGRNLGNGYVAIADTSKGVLQRGLDMMGVVQGKGNGHVATAECQTEGRTWHDDGRPPVGNQTKGHSPGK